MSYLRPFVTTPNRLPLLLLAVLLALSALLVARLVSAPSLPARADAALAPDFGKLPLFFVPNAGQTIPAVHFQAHSMGEALFFTSDEVVLALPASTASHWTHSPPEGRSPALSGQPSRAVRLRFEGTNPAPETVGADRLPGIVNYFIGDDPDRWRTHLPTYGEIIYRNLYPGVDLHYTGTAVANARSFSLKGTFTVAPGADPGCIRWHYTGVADVRLNEATGDLLITLSTGVDEAAIRPEIVERAPIVWQMVDGQRAPVSARYTIGEDGSIGFVLGTYNPAYPLTIDPTLTFSTYLGGIASDYGSGIDVDTDGNVYVTGWTNSTDFPTASAVQPNPGFSSNGTIFGDAFVVKLNATGSTLLYATYLGGTGGERGYDIAVDTSGNAYVTGETTSVDFPTQEPVQPTSGGGGPWEGDAFIAKLDPTGAALVYATYLGGGGDELGYGITVDAFGNAYVTGYTSSVDFPTAHPAQPDPAFPQGLNVWGDAFVTQVISASGVYTWGYSTYLGGVDWDEGHGIAVDASGNAYVTGNTRSADFPTAHPVQSAFGGGSGFDRGDAFVTQVINASGVYTWGYSTYLGGSGSDSGYRIAVDGSGGAYVTGETASADFPTLNPLQASNAGFQDAFVTKVITVSGVYTWGYSTFLGGGSTDIGRSIGVDADGNAHLTGNTHSQDFPTTTDAYDTLCGSDGLCDGSYDDVFYTKLNDDGDSLVYSTYLGGSRDDLGRGITVDAEGNAYLTGDTSSSDFPTSAGAYDPSCGTDGACNGAYTPDAFVIRITMAPDLALTKTADPPTGASVTLGDLITYTIAVTNSGAAATNLVITDVIPFGAAYVPGSVTSTMGTPGFDGTRVTVGLDSLATSATLAATFKVTVTTALTRLLTNKALLDSDQLEVVDSNLVSHPVRGTGEIQPVYLPILLKGTGETPPPSGCAPYLVATISVGDTPHGIAMDTARNRVYVANFGSDSLSVIDTRSNSVIQTITGITSANGVTYDPTHNLIWVTNHSSDQVTPIDAASLVPLPPVAVGDGPWGLAYDLVHDSVYVVNNLGDSVTVVDAYTRGEITTLGGDFDQPFHVAVNPSTGKAYVTNFGGHSVTVVNGASVSSVVDLAVGNPSTQPYGVAVDETRDLLYVGTVNSHRVVVIGADAGGIPDQVLGWVAFHRGFGDPARPVPMRAVAVNPNIGPASDGGHLWTTTSTADGGEANQALLIPKGWGGYFSYPVSYDVGVNPSEGIAVDRVSDRIYVTSGTTPGNVTVLGDSTTVCVMPFGSEEGIGFELFP